MPNRRTPIKRSAGLALRRRNPHFVEAALDHGVDLAHQNLGRDFVLGAAEFSERRQQSQIIEGFERQVRLSAFASERFSVAPYANASDYNLVIIALKLLAGDSNHVNFLVGEGFSHNKLKSRTRRGTAIESVDFAIA